MRTNFAIITERLGVGAKEKWALLHTLPYIIAVDQSFRVTHSPYLCVSAPFCSTTAAALILDGRPG